MRCAAADWHLVGNPYPAPLDYRLIAAADHQGLDAAIYVFSSTSQYGGQYRNVNGFGNPIIPMGQGFFVRVQNSGQAGTLNFHNTQRLTAPTTTTLQRTAAETRPAVQLTLQGAGNSLTRSTSTSRPGPAPPSTQRSCLTLMGWVCRAASRPASA